MTSGLALLAHCARVTCQFISVQLRRSIRTFSKDSSGIRNVPVSSVNFAKFCILLRALLTERKVATITHLVFSG